MQRLKEKEESEIDALFEQIEKKVVSSASKNEDTTKINPSVLRRLLGDNPTARILDFLSLYDSFDYSLTDIAKNSGVSWKTLHNVWPFLEKYEVVKMTRQIGRAKMYKLNPDSKIARALKLLNLEIAFFDAKKIAG